MRGEMKRKVKKKKRVRRMKLKKKVKKKKQQKKKKKKKKLKNRFLAVYAKHMSYFPANKTLPLIHSVPPVAKKSPLILQITPNHLSVCVAFCV